MTKPVFLVTGGRGFIGTWVIRELLAGGYGVVSLDAAGGTRLWRGLLEPGAPVHAVNGDIGDENLLATALDAHAITHVIHLVGMLTPACQADPRRGFEVNVLGTVRLLEAVRHRLDRVQSVTYASSFAVHGPRGAPGESPETFYGAFKRSVELVAEQYGRHFALRTVGLRPFVVYGAGRDTGLTAAPSLAARAAARGEPYELPFSGPAGLVYVGDVARAFVRCALDGPGGSRVVDMPGEQATMASLVELLDRLEPGSGRRLTIAGPPLSGHHSERMSRMEELFTDWRPTPLEEGLRRTVEGWKRFR